MHLVGKGSLFRCFAVAGLALLPAISTSCSSFHAQPTLTQIAEPQYARPILEKVLMSLAEGDYEAYLAYKHPSMRASNLKEVFDQSVISHRSLFGIYVTGSARFSEASFQYDNVHHMGFTVAYYYAKFTNDPERDVLVELALREIGGRNYVENVAFNVRGTYY